MLFSLQSGVIAGTATLSPILKSLTYSPTATTRPIDSCPKTKLGCLGEPPPNTVCTSDEQGVTAIGSSIAPYGVNSGSGALYH